MDDFWKVFLTSGVAIAAITGIFNLINQRNNAKLLHGIELMKVNHEMIQYRYIQLHKYLEEISLFESVSYVLSSEEGWKNTVEKHTARFHLVEKKYDLIYPLLDDDLQKNIDTPKCVADDNSNRMVELNYTQPAKARSFLADLMESRNKFEDALNLNTQKQISRLLSKPHLTVS